MNKIKIIVDTREQHPFLFESFSDVSATIDTLKTGDYSLVGASDPNGDTVLSPTICIERKSLSDLFLTLGSGRDRFINELERMVSFNFSAIVIESSFYDIMNNPPPMSEMHINAVMGSLFAFCIRYGVHVFACKDRPEAEIVTYNLLRRFWIDEKLF